MWYLFSVLEKHYSRPLIAVCSETSIQQKNLTISVINVVLILRYGDISHFNEKCGTYIQLWTKLIQLLKLMYAVISQSNKNVFTHQ